MRGISDIDEDLNTDCVLTLTEVSRWDRLALSLYSKSAWHKYRIDEQQTDFKILKCVTGSKVLESVVVELATPVRFTIIKFVQASEVVQFVVRRW